MSLSDSGKKEVSGQNHDISGFKKSSFLNKRTEKVLCFLVFGNFPNSDQDIHSLDLLHKIKEKFSSPEEIWRKSIDVINSSVTVAREPGQSDVEHYAAVQEKRDEYIEDLRVAYQEIYQIFNEEKTKQEIDRISDAERALVGEQLPGLKKLAIESADNISERVESERYQPDLVTIQSMKDFIEFTKLHRDEIEARRQAGESTIDIIYDIFYTEDLNALDRFQENDQKIEIVNEKLTQEAKRVEDRLNAFIVRLEENGNLFEITQDFEMKKSNWLYFRSFLGHDRKLPVGRIYLNIDWTAAPEALREILLSCWKDEIRMEAKTALSVSPSDINRNDKIVIYFNDKDTQAIIDKISELYKNKPEIFLDGGPQATAPVVDSAGEVMNGVLFAESPKNEYISFGQVRSAIFRRFI